MSQMSEDSWVSQRLVIRGLVQGVGYRFFTRDVACSMGLRGLVRNRSDGTVEIEVYGREPIVEKFKERLHQGPPGSQVTGMSEESITKSSFGETFEIAY